MQGNQDTSSDQSSGEQDTSRNYSPRHNSNRFRVSLAPEEERHTALSRIQKALDKVSNKRSTKRTGERWSCDLYVGNLDFKADAQDLSLFVQEGGQNTSRDDYCPIAKAIADMDYQIVLG